MKYRLPLKTAAAAAALSCTVFHVAAETSPARPNIIFILADDVRNDEMHCAGDAVLQTPHMDRLAEEGVRFANMFVTTPICMCSRATILTGLTLQTHQWAPCSINCHKLSDDMVNTSFPYLLRQAGYRTAKFGKNHVNFDCGIDAAYDRMFDQWKILNRPYWKEMPDGSRRHTAELIGEHADRFLKEQSPDHPFFLYMAFNIAHAEDNDHRPGIGQYPWPHEVDGLYDNTSIPRPHLDDSDIFNALPEFLKKSLNRTRWFWRWDTPEKYEINMRARYRMITAMDRIIGRTLDVLKQQGLADNTIIMYSADNGIYRGNRGLAGKWSSFDESLHVPLVVYDPRAPKNRRGITESPLVLNLDLPSTILNMAGIGIPETYQGRSLEPLLEGRTPADWRTDFFCQHYDWPPIIPGWSGVRTEHYMYACYDHQNPPYEMLYDLQRDTDELNNLIDNPEYAGILSDLHARLQNSQTEYTQARDAVHPGQIFLIGPAAKKDEKALNQPYDGGKATFGGKSSLKLGDTPALDVSDSFVWSFQVKIDLGNAPGAVLMGNRVTPGLSDLNFMKITAGKGVQFFGGSRAKSCILQAVLPPDRWVNVKLEKNAQTVTLFVDGESVAGGTVNFPLPAMPCYLGGDPNRPAESARCSIRNAVMEKTK